MTTPYGPSGRSRIIPWAGVKYVQVGPETWDYRPTEPAEHSAIGPETCTPTPDAKGYVAAGQDEESVDLTPGVVWSEDQLDVLRYVTGTLRQTQAERDQARAQVQRVREVADELDDDDSEPSIAAQAIRRALDEPEHTDGVPMKYGPPLPGAHRAHLQRMRDEMLVDVALWLANEYGEHPVRNMETWFIDAENLLGQASVRAALAAVPPA